MKALAWKASIDELFDAIDNARRPSQVDSHCQSFLLDRSCWLKIEKTATELSRIAVDDCIECEAYCYTLVILSGFDRSDEADFRAHLCDESCLHFEWIAVGDSVDAVTWTVAP